MDAASLLRLVALSAIWGGSFLFLRIAAPVLGPVVLAEFRVACAALFLLVVGWVLRRPLDAAKHWKHYLILGLLNSALPFLLFGYAAQTLSASVMAILNATAPIWSAVIGAVWARHLPSAPALLGLALGVAGVSVLVGFDAFALQAGGAIAIAAVLLASFCYGLATQYARTARSVEPFANAHGSMWAAAALLATATPFAPIVAAPGAGVLVAAAALGIVCSGMAYLLYFRLVADVGATSALTVTFLIPVFGILWGNLFLSEVVRWNTVVGAGIVLVGTALVTGFDPRVFARRGSGAA